MYSLKSLTDELAQAQNRLGITDVALAAATGVSRQTIDRIVNGKANFSVNTLLALTDVLGLTVMVLPKDAAQAFTLPRRGTGGMDARPVSSVVDGIKSL